MSLGEELLDLALDRPGHLLAGGRLVCVDGYAGSGKSTAAASLERAARSHGLRVGMVHMDDLYAGWSGLPRLGAVTAPLVEALVREGRAAYRRWDWELDARAEEHVVEAGDLVVLEGVGSAAPEYDGRVTLRVLVTAPREERLRRGVARDGEALRERWLTWQEAEVDHLREARTVERADVVVDGLTGRVSPPGDRGPARAPSSRR